MDKHTTTSTKSARVKESFTLKNASIFGGANLLADYAATVGLDKLLEKHLAVKKASYSEYPMHKSMSALILANALGHNRIFHLTGVENDPLLSLKAGWSKLPDYTTFYYDLHRFDTQEKVRSLLKVLSKLAERTMDTSYILDIDSTVETVYGSPEEAAVGYNAVKHGRPSYHPILAFDGLSQAMLNGELREGKAVSATGFTAFLHDTLRLYPNANVDFMRLDAGFSGDEIYNEAEEHTQKGYVIKIRQFPALLKKSAVVPWRRVEFTDYTVEVKSFSYHADQWNKARRIVMVRYRPADDPQQGQLKFTALDWDMVAMVTNLDWEAEDIWHFYNQRCCQENYIKEMKDGFGMDSIPSASFMANYAMMLLKGIAYNLVLGFRKEIGTPKFRRMTITRLRRELLMIAAVVVRHARQTFLKLATNYRWQEDYLWMRRRLEALT